MHTQERPKCSASVLKVKSMLRRFISAMAMKIDAAPTTLCRPKESTITTKAELLIAGGVKYSLLVSLEPAQASASEMVADARDGGSVQGLRVQVSGSSLHAFESVAKFRNVDLSHSYT